jgi:hypothetical protein
VLAVQVGVPFAVAQAFPQNPQLLTDVVVSVSQATAVSASHSPRPAPHGDT